LILELTQEIQDALTGIHYVVRVYGREQVDGTWEGWLEFVAVGVAIVSALTAKRPRATARTWRTGPPGWAMRTCRAPSGVPTA
jgi:hypothetical protein